MSTIRVNNKTNGPIAITHEPGAGAHLLTTGMNEVPSEVMKKALSHKSVRPNGEKFSVIEQMREDGKLHWDGDDEKPAASAKLSTMSEKDALRVVKETFDPNLLKTYAAEDNRPAIQKAITEHNKTVEEAIKKGQQ